MLRVVTSFIIPSYNEAKNLPLRLEKTEKSFQGREDIEVLIVDNGSTDESPKVLQKQLSDHPLIRSIRIDKNQGYGFGILSGFYYCCTCFIETTFNS